MNRTEAIDIMKVIVHMLEKKYDTDRVEDAVDIAIKSIEQVGCLTDRPCEYCKNHVDGRCAVWKCVFDDELTEGEE